MENIVGHKNEISEWRLFTTLTILLSLLLLLSVLGIYRITFANISMDPNYWGAFGDYFGGTVGTAVAAFALGWLIYAVKIQSKELKEVRNHFKLEAARADLQRAIGPVLDQIDIEERIWDDHLVVTNNIRDAFGSVSVTKNHRKKITVDGIGRETVEFSYDRLMDFGILFNTLGYYLREYDRNSPKVMSPREQTRTLATTYYTSGIAEKYFHLVEAFTDFSLSIDDETMLYFLKEQFPENRGGSIHENNVGIKAKKEKTDRWRKHHQKNHDNK